MAKINEKWRTNKARITKTQKTARSKLFPLIFLICSGYAELRRFLLLFFVSFSLFIVMLLSSERMSGEPAITNHSELNTPLVQIKTYRFFSSYSFAGNGNCSIGPVPACTPTNQSKKRFFLRLWKKNRQRFKEFYTFFVLLHWRLVWIMWRIRERKWKKIRLYMLEL